MNRKRVAVIGMGYVGIPAAVLLADAGHDVIGLQRRSQRSGWRIDWLNQGRCPIGGNEPELPEILQRVARVGKFRATDDYSVLRDVDVVLIDVQTPTDVDHTLFISDHRIYRGPSGVTLLSQCAPSNWAIELLVPKYISPRPSSAILQI